MGPETSFCHTENLKCILSELQNRQKEKNKQQHSDASTLPGDWKML